MFAVVTRWFSQSYNRKLLRNPRAEQGNHSFQLFLFSCNVRSVDFLLLSICRAHNPCTGNLFWLLKSLSLLCSTITTFNMISLVQKYNRDQRHSSYLLGLRQEYKRLMMDHIYIHKILTFPLLGMSRFKVRRWDNGYTYTKRPVDYHNFGGSNQIFAILLNFSCWLWLERGTWVYYNTII